MIHMGFGCVLSSYFLCSMFAFLEKQPRGAKWNSVWSTGDRGWHFKAVGVEIFESGLMDWQMETRLHRATLLAWLKTKTICVCIYGSLSISSVLGLVVNVKLKTRQKEKKKNFTVKEEMKKWTSAPKSPHTHTHTDELTLEGIRAVSR